MSDHDPFDFPCEVPLKVFGKNAEAFRKAALSIVSTHFADVTAEDVSEQLSREGSYVSLTIRVQVQTRAQMEAVYRDLHLSDDVLMVL